MDEALLLFHAHGVPGIALLVFAKRMGVPVPAIPFLLLAGARGTQDPFFALHAATAACVVTVFADWLWFLAGRRFGSRMLALMCKLSLAPETCIRRSELAFLSRSALTVLIAKFIPGVAGLSPPVAGALGMPAARFTALNLAGTLAWVSAGVGAGWLLHRQVAQVIAALYALGSLTVPLVVVAISAYIVWLAVRRSRVARTGKLGPRLRPEIVAQKCRAASDLFSSTCAGQRRPCSNEYPKRSMGLRRRTWANATAREQREPLSEKG